MKKKTIILYDLKDKTQVEKVQILRKLFGYRDTSNYSYEYVRDGKFTKLQCKRYKKAIIELQNESDLARVMEVINQLKIRADVAKIQ